MGYELHITRAEEWYESKESPIGLDEWSTYAHGDARLVVGGSVGSSDGDDVPVFVFVCADGTEVSLTWYEGEISIKGVADEVGAREFVSLAADLKANLMGDDGERYTAAGVIPAE